MSKEYDKYLTQHISNVKKGYDWLRENLPEVIVPMLFKDEHIRGFHDHSKYTKAEYDAYDDYFYGEVKTEKVKYEFNRAWLHHIHANPHHWQHWVLVNDDPEEGTIALPMDYEYVIEMICDWWAFSWAKNNLYEIFNWYDDHKKRMILHEDTRKIVENILGKIRAKLDSNKN